MKILHTSDWHLGQLLYGYDRSEEHLHFINQLLKAVADERPDALVVSGDIFDVSTPSNSTSRLFTDSVLKLHDVLPAMTIAIISGNHDSASRIDINRNLWKKAGIHVIGSVARDKEGGYDFSENIIEVSEKGYIVAVPYVNRAYLSKCDSNTGDNTGEDNGNQEKHFFKLAADYLRKRNSGNLPSVLMAHLTVEGCDMKGHRISQIGNVNAVPENIFPDDFDYVALGHIHRPQNMNDNGKIRYSGSPVAVSFDENYPHTITVADIGAGGLINRHEIEIHQKRLLKTFPHEAVDFKEAIRRLKKYPPEDSAYIRLNICQESDLPGDCQELAAAAVAEKKCRFCVIKYQRQSVDTQEAYADAFHISEFEELTPCEVARRLFEATGIPKDVTESYLSMISSLEEDYQSTQSL